MSHTHVIDPAQLLPGSILVTPNGMGAHGLNVQTSTVKTRADEPATLGGNGQGFSPYEYLLGALGSCTAMTLQMYAARKGFALGEFHVALSQRRDENKNLIIDKELIFHGNLSHEQIERLVDISKKCPVHRDLEKSVTINTHLHAH